MGKRKGVSVCHSFLYMISSSLTRSNNMCQCLPFFFIHDIFFFDEKQQHVRTCGSGKKQTEGTKSIVPEPDCVHKVHSRNFI
jgi:hypothetical protein